MSKTLKFEIYWASYFINGDDSGLDSEEKIHADYWLEVNNVRPVSDVEDSTRFTWKYQLYDTLAQVSGGEVCDYICEELGHDDEQALANELLQDLVNGKGWDQEKWAKR